MSYVMKSSRASSLLADSRRGNRAGRGVPFIALIPSTMEDKYDINENACNCLFVLYYNYKRYYFIPAGGVALFLALLFHIDFLPSRSRGNRLDSCASCAHIRYSFVLSIVLLIFIRFRHHDIVNNNKS